MSMLLTGCDYKVLKLLGAGGMSQVHSARHRRGFDLAIKTAKPGFAARLQREFEAVQAFKHPGIVTACPARLDGTCAGPSTGDRICLELVSGTNCLTLGQCHDWQQALHITQTVAHALGYMHELQWIHRDVKPSNVMVTPGGDTKLIDFGLARQQGTTSQASSSQTGAGTLAFMAPEQFYVNPDLLTPAVDCFALGGLLFHLLVGVPPQRDVVEGKWDFAPLADH